MCQGQTGVCQGPLARPKSSQTCFVVVFWSGAALSSDLENRTGINLFSKAVTQLIHACTVRVEVNLLLMMSNKIRYVYRNSLSNVLKNPVFFRACSHGLVDRRSALQPGDQAASCLDDVKGNFSSFQMKSTEELLRTWLILKLSSFNVVADNGEAVCIFHVVLNANRI